MKLRPAASALLLGIALAALGCFQPIGSSPGEDGGADGGGTSDGGDKGGCTTQPSLPVRVPSPPGEDAFIDIQAIEFDAQGRLWVLDRKLEGSAWTGSLVVLSPAPGHGLLRTMGRGVVGRVRNFTLSPGGDLAFILSWSGVGEPLVDRFAADGQWQRAFPLPQHRGEAIGMDAQGRLYSVSDRILRYDAEGQFQAAFGSWGTQVGQVGWGVDLLGAKDGTLWLADLARNNVQQYDLHSGQQIIEMGARGGGNGRFDEGAEDGVHWGPTRIAQDAQGRVYANDPFASRVQKFAPDGLFLGQFHFGGPTNIGAVAVEPSTGRVYVARKNQIDILCPF